MRNEEQLDLLKKKDTEKATTQTQTAQSLELVNEQKDIYQFIQNSNLFCEPQEWKRISKKNLINILNYLNFQDDTLFINFSHSKYGNFLSVKAKPLPCDENLLNCEWVIENPEILQKLSSYNFLHLHFHNNQKLIFVKPEVKYVSEKGITFHLPDYSFELSSRKTSRHLCKDIKADLIQNGVVFSGLLQEFSALSFSVEVVAQPPQSFQWINPGYQTYVVFKNDEATLYSGECRVIRQTNGYKNRVFVLEPLHKKISRFSPKEIRSIRHKISPTPRLIFNHPLTQKLVTMEVEDLAGSGFSVEEYYEKSVLIPGMIIPELAIEFINDAKIKCKAQVVHRNIHTNQENKVISKCGIAIIDMDIHDQGKFSSLLHQLTNRKSYVCNKVDIESLWKFFFETDFLYPKKYNAIHSNKEKFKELYEKLYIQNPGIARHFIYQDKGAILGHISMLRFYENTWLIHHHSAIKTGYNSAGLVVLDQVGRYINDFYRLYSTHMNFVICYFRPENRFPSRVFGGYTQELLDPKGCSLDAFAYFHFPKDHNPLPVKGIELVESQLEDIQELKEFYEFHSGGLMMNALDLDLEFFKTETINEAYQEIGFKRERRIYSLRKDNDLVAVIMMNLSNVGLNMSNLTNCIHVIVMSDRLTSRDLYTKLSELVKYYEEDEIPVLLFPVNYAQKQSIIYDKVYNLWVLNIPSAGEQYLKYIESLLNRSDKKDLKSSQTKILTN